MEVFCENEVVEIIMFLLGMITGVVLAIFLEIFIVGIYISK